MTGRAARRVALALALAAAPGVARPGRPDAALPGPPGAAASGALPEGTARWRMTLAGVPVGLVELAVRCEGPACQVTWSSRQRLPAEAGGGLRERRVTVAVDRAGRAAGPTRRHEDGEVREVALPSGAVPAMLAEVLLARAPAGCLDAADEGSGAPLRACVRDGDGGVRVVETGGAAVLVRPGPGPYPAELSIPAQRVRFTLDAAAAVPARAPRLYGAEVPGPADPRDAARFCGVAPDPAAPPEAAAGLPRPAAPGPTCREKSLAWAEAARARGLPARVAIGVAHDGGAFVWHAWAEARVGGRWVAVDPSFRQAPARGPRFTLATFAPGDEAGRQAAGRRILACWGRARVEAAGSAPR